MSRITEKQLAAVVDRLNEITNRPREPYTRTPDGKIRGNVGNYHISMAYGGVCLHEMAGEGGGVRDVFRCGHIPKRELYNRMQAFLSGIEVRTA